MYKINILYVVYFLSSYHVFHHWPWCFSLGYYTMNLYFYIFQNISPWILRLSLKHYFLINYYISCNNLSTFDIQWWYSSLNSETKLFFIEYTYWSVKIGLRVGIKCHYIGNDSTKGSLVWPIVFNFIIKLNAAVEKISIFCRRHRLRRPVWHHRK